MRNLDRAAHDGITSEFEIHWASNGPRMHEALGIPTWNGGRRMDDWRLLSAGVTIRFIALELDAIGRLDLDTLAAVQEAIALGARATMPQHPSVHGHRSPSSRLDATGSSI